MVAIAEPGCGKTLAYAVPLLIRAAALQGMTGIISHLNFIFTICKLSDRCEA